MPDSREKLYKAISSQYDLGTFEEFNTKMDIPESRKRLYELVSNDFDLGTYNDFETKIGGAIPQKKNETPKIPSAQPLPKGADSFSNVWRPALQSKSPSGSGGSTEFLAILNNIKSEVGKPQTPPKPTGDAYTDRLVKRAKRGLDQLNVGLMKAPEFIYNIAAIPQNVVAEKFDIPELATSAERVKKDLGINNEAAEYYKNQVNQLAYLDSKYDKPVTELISSGNYGDAARLLGEQIFESLPTTIALAASGGMGATSTAMTLGGGAVFGANEYDAMGDVDMPESEKVAIALSKGMLEGLIENMGTVGLGRLAKGVVEKQGKEAGKQIVKQSFIDAYTAGLKKYMPISGAIQESIEEGATQFANNAIDKFTGVNPNVSLTDGVLDNMLVGLGSGAVISAPISLIANRSKEIEQKAKEIDAIDSDIQKENVSEDTKAVLNNERQKKMSEINDILKEETDYQKTLPIEVKEKIDDLSDNVEMIEASLAEDISDESRKIFETQKADILKEIEELKNAGTNTIEQPIEGGVIQPTTTPQGDSGVIEEGVTETNIQTEIDEKAQTEKAEVGVLDSDTALPTDGSPAAETGVVQGDALKDIESTAKALGGVDINDVEKIANTIGETLNKKKAKIDAENNSAITSYGKQIKFRISRNTDAEIEQDFLTITAVDNNGNKVGYAKFIDNGKNNLEGSEVEVPEKYQKKGIASAIYSYADAKGYKVDESVLQTPEGRALWKSLKTKQGSTKSISEAYHKAKADGSNPELVAAVEELLGQKTSPSVQAGVEAGSVVGGEVVKDDKGQPLTVFHGTGKEFTDFDIEKTSGTTRYGKGVSFVDAKGIANRYSLERQGLEDSQENDKKAIVKEANVSIKAPFDDRGKIDKDTPQAKKLIQILTERFGLNIGLVNNILDANIQSRNSAFQNISEAIFDKNTDKKTFMFKGDTEKTRAILEEAGYDSIIGEYEDATEYFIFNPKNILSKSKQSKETPAKQELTPPVVEQTTTDEGGVTTPTVSQEGLPLTVDSKQETVELTPEQKEKHNKQASGLGWDNAPQAINSINKRLGTDYKTWESIPKHVKEFVSSFRNAVEKQKTDFNVALKAAYKYLDMAVKDGEITREEADNLANMAAERATPKTEKKGTLAEGVSATTQLNQADFKNQKITKLNALKQKFNSFFKGFDKGLKEGKRTEAQRQKYIQEGIDTIRKELMPDIEKAFNDKNITNRQKFVLSNMVTRLNEKNMVSVINYLDRLLGNENIENQLADEQKLTETIIKSLESEKSDRSNRESTPDKINYIVYNNYIDEVVRLIETGMEYNKAILSAKTILDNAIIQGSITQDQYDAARNYISSVINPQEETSYTDSTQADFKNQKVSMLKAMREKFNSFFKGEKKGAKEKLALIESLNTEFKNYIKESGFDDQKIRKVLKYFGKINTIQKLNKALLEMDKMIEDREYLDKVIEAQSLKEKVKAKLKTNKKSFGNYYNKAKDFSGINPSSILDTELLDLYIKIAKDLTNTVIPKIESLKEVQAIYDKVQKNDEIKSLKDETLGNSLEGSTLVEKIANAIEKMEELEITNIKDVRAFRRLYQYAYNKNLELTSGIANLNEIDSIEETAIENDKKLEELKEKFGELLKDFSDEFVDSINTSKEDFTLRNAMSLFPEFENDLIYFYNDIKPLDLGLIDLELYKAILDGMESGFINDQLTSFVRRHKAQKIAESALSDFIESIPFEEKRATLIQKLKSPLLGKELENFSGNETAKVVKYLISQYPSEIDRFLGLNDTFWNKVWNPINRAYTQWVSDYEERLVDFRKTIGRFNEKDQRVTAIAMKQMDYIDNMTQEIRDNLRKQAIKYFESKNKTEPTQADLAKIEDGLNDWFYTMTELIPTKTVEYDITEDVKAYKVAKRAIGADGKVDVKKLDTKYQKAIEKSREVLDALAPLAKYNTLSDGKQWEERVSYFPSFTKSEMLGVVENDFDKLLKSGDVTKFVGYTSGSTFKRVDDVFYINLNLNNQVSSAIKEVTKQYHMKGAVNSSLGGLRRMMGNEQIATSKNRKKISLALYHTTRKLLAAQFVQNYVSNIFDKISGNLKLSILSSIYRPMLETATAIPKAMFVTRDLTLPYQVIKLAFNRTFPKYESEMSKAITGFSGGHKGLINEYTSAAEKVSKQAMELTSASSRSQLAKFAKWWVSVAESIISPAVFYRQLVKEYKKETGKLFDAEKYNKDKDYQIEVRSVMEKIAPKLERVLEDAVVVQSKINSPVTFMFGKIEKGSKVSGIYNILNPFTSVIAKERVLFRKGLYEISNGDYVGGLSKVGAVFANAYLYSLMSQIAISKTTVYTAMLSQYLLQSLGDDDEDDEEMLKMLKAMEQAGEQRFEEMWDLDTQMYQAIGSFFAGAIGEYAYLLRPALALVIANVLKSDEELRVDTIKKQKILKAVNSSGIINVNKNLNYSDVSDYAKAYLGLGATLVDDLQGVLDTYELTTEKKNLLKKDMAVFTGYSTALAIAQTLHPAPLSQDFKRSLDQMARMSNPMYATNFIEAASMQRATKMLEVLNEINEKENKKYKTLNEIPKSTLANYDSYKEISVVDERFNKMLNTGILFKFEPNYNKNMTEFEKKQRVERLNKKHRSSYINTSEKMLERVSETPSTLEKIDKEFEKAKDKATLLFESITARDK